MTIEKKLNSQQPEVIACQGEGEMFKTRSKRTRDDVCGNSSQNPSADTFQVIRNEQEHQENGLRDYAKLYLYYREMGCSRQDARKYAKWSYENRIKNGKINDKD